MLRSILVGLALLSCVVAASACGDETPSEHEHACTDGQIKCEGDLFSVCNADKFGTPEACPSGQKCMVMDGGAMCM